MLNYLLSMFKNPAMSSRSLNTSALRFEHQKIRADTHTVNNLEKRFLVWTGKFKSIDEVPARIAPEIMEKSRNKMRIRVANAMMGLTLVSCLGIAIYSKKAHKAGDSVQKRNLDWHQKVKDEAELEKQKQ